jgi:hypothetical protein
MRSWDDLEFDDLTTGMAATVLTRPANILFDLRC